MPTFNIPDKLILNVSTFKEQLDTINAIIDALGNKAFQAESVLMFDSLIEKDIVVPSDKRALSIDVTIIDGKTVTVEDGASFVVL